MTPFFIAYISSVYGVGYAVPHTVGSRGVGYAVNVPAMCVPATDVAAKPATLVTVAATFVAAWLR